ncbi:sugar ABC transporter ATPase [Microbacterium radiodurans]|uniref:Sugar ABC transporter ATPase n=1 Tax=Microbacterium radiodurans TaxID=661398 RepID=A0A5J5IUL4_9MICO|nr:sugar ABC transporter ATPase [Microbacterium radiodurans]KAA9089854.1 sugar ABC transporter ATPase [Microbacterium radiodurans]
MSNAFNDDLDRPAPAADAGVQPLRDGDATSEADPSLDPAQQEWERTEAIDDALEAGVDPAVLDTATATGADPAEIVSDDDEIPAEDLPVSRVQPETQGEDPVVAELGEEGEGDLGPEDL